MLVVILTLGLLQQAYGMADSQTVTLKFEKASIKSIFKEINKQTGYEFLFSSQMIEKSTPVTATLNKSTIDQALEICLKDQPFDYTIEGKTIVIIPQAKKQSVIVKGKVADIKDVPLFGANIVIKGTQKGTVADITGKFQIEAPINSTLTFSFLGFISKEVIVTKDEEIIVILQEANIEINEASLVSTGYQKINPEQSTGSLASITAKEFDTRVNTTNFLQGIQNKIPGLLINNDVTFEENSLFQIRGISTIHGDRKPLIVIDGFPTELSLDMINPNEIETITVLKDAAAATIYGARSSNGVIIIDRKKAKIGRPNLNFRSTLSFTPKENYSRYRWDENGTSIITEWDKINPQTLISPNSWDLIQTASGSAHNLNPSHSIIAQWMTPNNPISIEERDRQLAALATYNNTEDYSRLFLRTSTLQTYNLDISGGNESARYYFTINYSDNALNKVKHNNNQFSFSGRTSLQLSPKFWVELTNDFLISESSSVPIPDIKDLFPYERFEDASGTPVATYYGSKAHLRYNKYMTDLGLLDNLYYPLLEMELVNDKVRTVSNRFTANLRYKINNNLNISLGGIYETSSTETKHLAHQNSAESRQMINYYTTGTIGKLVNNIPVGGNLRQNSANKDGFTVRAQLNYNKDFSGDHALNFIFGGELREIVDKSKMSSYFGYDDLTLFVLPVDFKTLEGFQPVYGKSNGQLNYSSLYNQKYYNNRFVSGYSNLVYSYKKRYSITGSIRIDQSNLFGTNPKYKYKPLWSLGAAWNIHKEDFMEKVNFVTTMKLRTAYGFNGNVAKNALPEVIAQNGLNSITPNEVTKMLLLYSYANNGLRWEQTQNFNIGLDMTLFDKVDVSLDYYIKKSTDILANTQIDATKGGSSALMNRASILNKGFEVDFNSDWITRKKFNFNTGLVFSLNSSEVLEIYNTVLDDKAISRTYLAGRDADYLKGYSVGAIFALRNAGVDSEGYPLVYDAEGNAKRYFTADKGLKELDYMGSSIPVYSAGFNTRVDVGNFYVYCMLHLYGGFKTRVPAAKPYDKRPLEGAGNYWKKAGDESVEGILPSPSSLNNSVYLTYTDKYTVNGTYMTLGDITASYNFRNTKLLEKTNISNLELRAQASNVYTIGFNKFNFSKATKFYEKKYLTPTYTLGLYVSF